VMLIGCFGAILMMYIGYFAFMCHHRHFGPSPRLKLAT
jgi:hypothetical protein